MKKNNDRANEAISEMNSSDGLAFHKAQSGGSVKGIPNALLKDITDPTKEGSVINIPLKYISDSENIRRHVPDDEEFRGLVESIKENGLIQYPTIAYQKGKIILLAGNRRFKAVSALGWERVKCIVKIIDSEKERLSIQLAENINRSNLRPLDYAEAVSRLKAESELTNERIAEVLGKGVKTIEWLIKISNWSDENKQLVEDSNLKITPLLAIAAKKESSDPLYVSKELANLIASRHKEVEVEPIAHDAKSPEARKRKKDESKKLISKLSKKKQILIQNWVSSRGKDESTTIMLLEFLKDMKIKGWFEEEFLAADLSEPAIVSN